ncbi:bifunctional DNA-formamidopyrimidine glycosylase/DNA-(apurinic or apyrimidinic site) lyase [Schlesneria paludicola]|uniref:bifunctional DNA-formamidopyrimidine glycosylase/DNA-(apurinic or apyrimidinic site) lyase n=1 Tax=Schlesneria paludicola TaxID=360056 RepID=UPI0004924725|nr:bifunctional DNA-formamidopyrimidine glycosylase/DNA-(apurinic or apyrimidinic site) lyase [Schlesneria paludicola]
MPELPEVETMVRGIRPHVVGRTIRAVTACPNTCRPISVWPKLPKLQKRLIGNQFSAVRRLGKRVVLDVADGSSLVLEPRMTGLVVLTDPPDTEHLRLQWTFDDGQPYESLWFWDRRGLGTVQLFDSGQLEAHYCSSVLGPDALEMTLSQWTESCSRTQRAIKVVLLDQKVVAGIGNLYASEILHRAGIHPATESNTIGPRELKRMVQAVQEILLTAIEYEGSTLGDGTYRNALNQNGRYQNKHQVYKRDGQPCLVCRLGQIVRVVQAQRATFFCPLCQKAE